MIRTEKLMKDKK